MNALVFVCVHVRACVFLYCSVLVIVCALLCSLLLAESELHYGVRLVGRERVRERSLCLTKCVLVGAAN